LFAWTQHVACVALLRVETRGLLSVDVVGHRHTVDGITVNCAQTSLTDRPTTVWHHRTFVLLLQHYHHHHHYYYYYYYSYYYYTTQHSFCIVPCVATTTTATATTTTTTTTTTTPLLHHATFVLHCAVCCQYSPQTKSVLLVSV